MAIGRMNSGSPQKALEVLSQVDEKDRSPAWYFLVFQANGALYDQSKAEGFRTAALATVDAGIAKFPRSARLRLDKAFFLFKLERDEEARQCLEDAVDLAEKNLSERPAGTEAEIDRGVLAQAVVLRDQLGRR